MFNGLYQFQKEDVAKLSDQSCGLIANEMGTITCDKCSKDIKDIKDADLVKVSADIRITTIRTPPLKTQHFHKNCWERFSTLLEAKE